MDPNIFQARGEGFAADPRPTMPTRCALPPRRVTAEEPGLPLNSASAQAGSAGASSVIASVKPASIRGERGEPNGRRSGSGRRGSKAELGGYNMMGSWRACDELREDSPKRGIEVGERLGGELVLRIWRVVRQTGF